MFACLKEESEMSQELERRTGEEEEAEAGEVEDFGVDGELSGFITADNALGLKEALLGLDKSSSATLVTKLIFMACSKDSSRCLGVLLASPPRAPKVDAADKSNGRSALHRACCYHSTKCIELLLKHGASVSNKSKRALLPVEEALLSRRLEVEWNTTTPAETIVKRVSHKDLSAIQALVQPCKEHLVTVASNLCKKLKLVPLVALLLVAGHLVNAVTKKAISDVFPPGTLVDHLLSKVLAPLPMSVLERPVEAMQVAPIAGVQELKSSPEKDKQVRFQVTKTVQTMWRKIDSGNRERLNEPPPLLSHPPPNKNIQSWKASEQHVGTGTSFEMAMKLLECVLVFSPRLSAHAQSSFPAPLIRACQANDYKVVDLLLRSGANPNEQDPDGNTGLHWILRQATALNRRPVSLFAVQKLLDAGASIMQGNRMGATPVHTAAGHGHHDALFLMLQKNATGVRVLSTAKETPLHYAAMNNHIKCGAILLKFGANRNVGNYRDIKPRNLATSREMYALLGADEETIRKSSWQELAAMFTPEFVGTGPAPGNAFTYTPSMNVVPSPPVGVPLKAYPPDRRMTKWGRRTDIDVKKVFVGGLPTYLTSKDLREEFEFEFGDVDDAIVIRANGKSRGFGFVVFNKMEAAIKAVKRHYIAIQGKKVEIKGSVPLEMLNEEDVSSSASCPSTPEKTKEPASSDQTYSSSTSDKSSTSTFPSSSWSSVATHSAADPPAIGFPAPAVDVEPHNLAPVAVSWSVAVPNDESSWLDSGETLSPKLETILSSVLAPAVEYTYPQSSEELEFKKLLSMLQVPEGVKPAYQPYMPRM